MGIVGKPHHTSLRESEGGAAMKPLLDRRATRGPSGVVRAAVFCVALCGLLTAVPLQAADLPGLTVIGVAPDGTETDISDFRWMVQLEKTYHVQTDGSGSALPTDFDPTWDQGRDGLCGDGSMCIVGGDPCADASTCTERIGGETLAVSFHQSFHPVVAKGCAGTDDAWQTAAACNEVPFVDPDSTVTNYYYVSVVPRSGYSIGGASFTDDDDGVTVYVNEHPIPTAQISILIFHDNEPLNNAPDFPTEDPAEPGGTDMTGFSIVVEDAGGRYGASAGVQSQDVFGKPLGTTYTPGCTPVADPYDTSCVSGWAPLITGPDGRLTIKNLAPGKYGIIAIPPAGQGWQQTATIEGTKVIDAWVKANEPPFFAEFGPAGFHVFIGFVQPTNDTDVLTGGETITGTVVNQHLSRPPDYALHPGACFGHTTPWVGLNTAGGLGPAVYAAPTDDNCSFEIANVPDGNYQLAVWDSNLDLVFGFHGITISTDPVSNITTCSTPSGSCDLGLVPAFQWFHRQEHRVFDDAGTLGLWESGEPPSALETGFNLRWRDGTIYQGNVSDGTGAFTFDQVFPFFSWLVAEVDFARFQATGVTVVVDDGGAIPAAMDMDPPIDGLDWTFGRTITPQNQANPTDQDCGSIVGGDPCEETALLRAETGPVLTQGVQGFLGQTNAFLWGKRHYPDINANGDVANGGISGMVFYAVTRAENDVRYAAAEVWEPGIPGVTVNLRDAITGVVLATTSTDSWDDAIPTGCKWGNDGSAPFMFDPDGTNPDGSPFGLDPMPQDCYDGLRVFNQARPGVFDGGYAFGPEIDCPDDACPDWVNQSDDDLSIGYMRPGDYVVEVIPPPGYELVKPENKNVDFGDEYIPAPELLPAPCVGDPHQIPQYLTMFPDEAIESPFVWQDGEYVGDDPLNFRPLCDQKLVTVSNGANAAADFFLFTEVPVAAQGFGVMLDDTQNEFDPNSPQFGEKYAPPFVPVTIRDWTGRVIGKTLSDQYGRFNFLAASTITANLPQPSGMSPNMLTACMNDPGDNPDPEFQDPNWNQQYSTFCYTFQYMPGVTTYLDTPVVPIAAFTGPDQFPLDCEYPDGTPRIYSVDVGETNGVGGGPYIPTRVVGNGNNARVETDGAHTITITSMGTRLVQNPEYCNLAAGPCPPEANTAVKFVERDFGFGDNEGTVTLGDLGILSCTWGADVITCAVPDGIDLGPRGSNQGNNSTPPAVGGRQLMVNRDNGRSTKAGVTVQVGLRAGANAVVVGPMTPPTGPPPTTSPVDQYIQDAIDAAGPNDLILVRPAIYNEMVVMHKPVQLQGFGEGSTTINAIKAPPEKLATWRTLVDGLIFGGTIDLLPGQEVGGGAPEPVTLWNEEGAGVLVLAAETGNGNNHNEFDYQNLSPGNNAQDNRGARIDGFTIKSADTGGGIIANGYTDFLQISNNRISNNQGFYGGGIRIGHPLLIAETDMISPDGCPGGAATCYPDADNDYVWIHHNQVVFNGGLGGVGAGISMCTGADSYSVTENWVCGNLNVGDGGGIGHVGVSDRADDGAPLPLIAYNWAIFNEVFNQAQAGAYGGGIQVSGAPPLTPGGLSPGAGNVIVDGNLIQGNSAGAGDGGGVRLFRVNGQDVADNPDDPDAWYTVGLYNNMIVNNVTGLAGGGVALEDAVQVDMIHNTIANNDSLATAGNAFAPGSPSQSTPQPGAGVMARGHSPALSGIGAAVGTSSEPAVFADNIIWQNRQFFFFVDGACLPGTPDCTATFGLCPDLSGAGTPLTCPGGNDVVFDDVFPLTMLPGTTNLLTQPGSELFEAEYFNGSRSSVVQNEGATAIAISAAFDEGGNYIRAAHGPLSLYDDATPNNGDPGVLWGDYHILDTSDAFGEGTDLTSPGSPLVDDFDGDGRPNGDTDIGADEYYPQYPAPAVTTPPHGDAADATAKDATE